MVIFGLFSISIFLFLKNLPFFGLFMEFAFFWPFWQIRFFYVDLAGFKMILTDF